MLRSITSGHAKPRGVVLLEVPLSAAGPGTPNCAVIGLPPGPDGHSFLDRLSQTVKTKSFRLPRASRASSALAAQAACAVQNLSS